MRARSTATPNRRDFVRYRYNSDAKPAKAKVKTKVSARGTESGTDFIFS